MLRDLEISLRTNPIEWVQEFLDVSTNNGLDVMVKYLSSLLCVMKQTELQQNCGDEHGDSDTPVFDTDKAGFIFGQTLDLGTKHRDFVEIRQWCSQVNCGLCKCY